ncbi:uncharacterized protein LOC112685370 [Sipha flava]|uniref:Uncharacterized protein LOC112685370 n=1 Tax=Sipha flava TaxID=143950 RepID=A0A8B8FRM7_9HEMI|nr:uncharacterized protein LOC112685370 [Sipha flava]
MSNAGNVLLVLAAATAAMVAAKPLVYRSNLSELEFIQLVLMNERYWTPVLAERVKNLDQPPYQNARFRNQLISEEYLVEDMGYDVRSVVMRVLEEFTGIRSFVDYAASVLHTALMCHSARHLAFQTYYVALLMIKNAGAGLVAQEAGRLRETVTMMLDKLAVYSADIPEVFNTYWEAVRVIQSNAPRHVRESRYPRGVEDRVWRVFDVLHSFLEENCEPFSWDRRFFDACHIPVTDDKVFDKVLIADVSVAALREMGSAHVTHVTTYFQRLGLETLPVTLWQQVFYYADKRTATVHQPNETNVRITAAVNQPSP